MQLPSDPRLKHRRGRATNWFYTIANVEYRFGLLQGCVVDRGSCLDNQSLTRNPKALNPKPWDNRNPKPRCAGGWKRRESVTLRTARCGAASLWTELWGMRREVTCHSQALGHISKSFYMAWKLFI